MIIGITIIAIVSILLLVLGWLLWKKEKITLLHDYHYDKVSQENKKTFCSISGIGLIVIGIGLGITAVILGITNSALSFIPCAVGFATGLSLLVYAGKKYNF